MDGPLVHDPMWLTGCAFQLMWSKILRCSTLCSTDPHYAPLSSGTSAATAEYLSTEPTEYAFMEIAALGTIHEISSPINCRWKVGHDAVSSRPPTSLPRVSTCVRCASMCNFTPYTVIYRECQQRPKHTEERMYWEYCNDIPGTYTHCPDATRHPDRVVGSTRVTGECPVCASQEEEEAEEMEDEELT